MRILKYEKGDIVPTAEAMAIPEFQAIRDKDTTMTKRVWLKELAYVYLMHCPCQENGYYLFDEDTRRERLKLDLFGKYSMWKPDDVIAKAEARYREILDNIPAVRMLRTFRKALDDADRFLKNLDLNERDKNGKPIWKPKDIYDALDKLDAAYTKLKKIEKDVYKEFEVRGRIRGGFKRGYYED